MRQLVVGLGEVGAPLREILDADGYDLQRGAFTPDHYDVLHITIPYRAMHFEQAVLEYQTVVGPRLTIIHSTVPIGTTARFERTVHSPVNGSHYHMRRDLLTVPKLIGGPLSREAAILFDIAHIPVGQVYPRAEQTEALKLMCLAKYGIYIATSRMMEEIAHSVGITVVDVLEWDRQYNEHVPTHLRRPLITPQGDRIGGHCVIPGVALLEDDRPHRLLEGVLQYGS